MSPAGSRSPSPPPALVLLALARAIRQDPAARREVSARAVLAHLGLPSRSLAGVRRSLVELASAGLLRSRRRHGRDLFGLTRRGVGQVRRTAADPDAPALPESPQHRTWRTARAAASAALPRLRATLEAELLRALTMLAAEPEPDSDAWLALAESLRASSRAVGSAVHCLREWAEPEESRADRDRLDGAGDEALPAHELAARRALRAGRRNIRLWPHPPG